MKSTPLPVLVIALLPAVVFFFASRPDAFASGEDQIDQALVTSKNWVNQIDAGKYEESYSLACGPMRDKTPQTQWVAVLKALRTPWGPVTSRTQISHIYKPNGVPGLSGECEVITYDTSFKNLDPATEVVILKWEDGKWLGAGYRVGPKQSADDVASAPFSPGTTETHTEEHVKPTPQ